jgi:hypothetical protein
MLALFKQEKVFFSLDSWFGSDSEHTWKKCSDNKRKQRRVSER